MLFLCVFLAVPMSSSSATRAPLARGRHSHAGRAQSTGVRPRSPSILFAIRAAHAGGRSVPGNSGAHERGQRAASAGLVARRRRTVVTRPRCCSLCAWQARTKGEGRGGEGHTREHKETHAQRLEPRSLTPRCGVMHWARCAQTSSLLSRRTHETIFEMRPSARSALLLLCAALLCVLPLSSAFTPVSRRQSNIDAAAARGEPLVLPDRDCLNDDGSTVWMCISTVLVLGMCPALALFEAGMLRSKSTVSIVTQVISGVVTLSVMWILIGHNTIQNTEAHSSRARTRALECSELTAASLSLLCCHACGCQVSL